MLLLEEIRLHLGYKGSQRVLIWYASHTPQTDELSLVLWSTVSQHHRPLGAGRTMWVYFTLKCQQSALKESKPGVLLVLEVLAKLMVKENSSREFPKVRVPLLLEVRLILETRRYLYLTQVLSKVLDPNSGSDLWADIRCSAAHRWKEKNCGKGLLICFWAPMAKFWSSSGHRMTQIGSFWLFHLKNYSHNTLQIWCLHLWSECSQLIRFLAKFWPSSGQKINEIGWKWLFLTTTS